MADCDIPSALACAGLLVIAALVVVWAWRELRPLLLDGYKCRGRTFGNHNIVAVVDPQNPANAGPTERLTLARQSNFFPASGTTFFGSDSTMTTITDPAECTRIGLRPEFVMIQGGKPVYRCVRTGEPMTGGR